LLLLHKLLRKPEYDNDRTNECLPPDHDIVDKFRPHTKPKYPKITTDAEQHVEESKHHSGDGLSMLTGHFAKIIQTTEGISDNSEED
jgi:hypothetical protein